MYPDASAGILIRYLTTGAGSQPLPSRYHGTFDSSAFNWNILIMFHV